MSREKNDGRGRLGGRKKGTPNKITTEIREWMMEVVDGNTGRFVECMNMLEPQEYVRVFLRLLNFVLPKQAPIKPDGDKADTFQEFMSQIVDAN